MNEKEFIKNLQYLSKMNLENLSKVMNKSNRNICSKQDVLALRKAIKSIKKVGKAYMGII